MKQERVIAILDFYRDIDKTVTMNERVIRNLEDQYYSTLGAVNSDGSESLYARQTQPCTGNAGRRSFTERRYHCVNAEILCPTR